MSKKKVKEISLPMKYNPGLSKFESELPLGKSKKRFKIKINWILYLILIVAALCIGYFILVTLITYNM